MCADNITRVFQILCIIISWLIKKEKGVTWQDRMQASDSAATA